MLKNFLLSASVIVCCLWFSVPVVSASMGEKPDKQGTIAVTGLADDEVSPDTAVITLSVETRAKTVQDAARENGKIIGQVIAALKKMVKMDAGDSLKTASYQVRPEYEYDKAKRKDVITGYLTVNQITVETGRIGEAGEIIDSALVAGANNVSGMRFILRDDRKYCRDLLIKAAEQARSEAETVASALGVKLAGVRHIAPACGAEGPPPIIRGASLMRAAESAEASTPIEAGKLKLNARVAVEFYLEK